MAASVARTLTVQNGRSDPMNGGEKADYTYRVDANDVIVAVDSWWLAFARENGAAHLTADSVIGTFLWDFIAGQLTRSLYQRIHAQLRTSGTPLRLPFRCDSPMLERHMRMTITPHDNGDLVYETRVLRTKVRRSLPLLDPNQPRSTSQLVLCSSCLRAFLEGNGWLDVEKVAARLLDDSQPPELIYRLCPPCEQAFREAGGDGTAA